MAHAGAARLALTVLAVVTATACATVGSDFNHAVIPTLDFGSMTSGEYRAVFGEPSGPVYKETNADGTFERVRYRFSERSMPGGGRRMLYLDFRDGRLNAWMYGSNFPEDRTVVDMSLASKIRKGVDRKHDVQTLLGKPTGKARCPSSLVDYKERCKDSSEVWTWILYSAPETAPRTPFSISILYVVFDTSGMVAQVETTTESTQP